MPGRPVPLSWGSCDLPRARGGGPGRASGPPAFPPHALAWPTQAATVQQEQARPPFWGAPWSRGALRDDPLRGAGSLSGPHVMLGRIVEAPAPTTHGTEARRPAGPAGWARTPLPRQPAPALQDPPPAPNLHPRPLSKAKSLHPAPRDFGIPSPSRENLPPSTLATMNPPPKLP